MTRYLTTFTLCLLGLCTLIKAQTLDIAPIVNDNQFNGKDTIRGYWHPNTHLMQRTPGGSVAFADHGRSGTCLTFKNSQDNSLACVYSMALIPLNLATDTLTLSVYAKGNGKLTVALYAYDKNMRYVTTKTLKRIQLDSQQWTPQSVTIKAATLHPRTHGVRIVFEAQGKANFSLDDFEGQRTTLLE